jgi:hypothetical protein
MKKKSERHIGFLKSWRIASAVWLAILLLFIPLEGSAFATFFTHLITSPGYGIITVGLVKLTLLARDYLGAHMPTSLPSRSTTRTRTSPKKNSSEQTRSPFLKHMLIASAIWYGIPPYSRARRCYEEYDQMSNSWNTLLYDHIK